MNLELDREQAEELEVLIAVSLRELSHEIAATDNAGYRSELVDRRNRLRVVKEEIARLLAPASVLPRELVRELARPGD